MSRPTSSSFSPRTIGLGLFGSVAFVVTCALATSSSAPRDERSEPNAREVHLVDSRGALDHGAAVGRTRPSEARRDQASTEARFEGTPWETTKAIEDVVTLRDSRIETLTALAAVPLDQDGYVAAAAIRALGDLATEADPAGKTLALRALTTHLTRERQRASTDTLARGNVSLLVDALADTGSPAAVLGLCAALDAGTLPLHQETRIVEALTALGDPSGLRAIESFRARIERENPQELSSLELRSEALLAADRARASLGG
jgi:hypothetical protein